MASFASLVGEDRNIGADPMHPMVAWRDGCHRASIQQECYDLLPRVRGARAAYLMKSWIQKLLKALTRALPSGVMNFSL